MILTGCQTAPEPRSIDIPPFPIVRPERPELQNIPSKDTTEAIRALTKNMNKLITYSEHLELYNELNNEYYENILIITN